MTCWQVELTTNSKRKERQRKRTCGSQVSDVLCRVKREAQRRRKNYGHDFSIPLLRATVISLPHHGVFAPKSSSRSCQKVQDSVMASEDWSVHPRAEQERALGHLLPQPCLPPPSTPALSLTLDMVHWLQTSVSSFGTTGLSDIIKTSQ